MKAVWKAGLINDTMNKHTNTARKLRLNVDILEIIFFLDIITKINYIGLR